MKWFRNWFDRPPVRRSHSPRSPYRPCLEALEDRCVPTISHMFFADGQVATLITFNNGVLFATTPFFTGVVASGVKDAHAYRDPNGFLGADIVFQNGVAVQLDSTGTRLLGTNVQEASTTFDRNGNFLTVLAQENGTVLFVQPTGTTVVGTNFAGASTFLDVFGGIGLFLNYKLGNGTFLVETDSTMPKGIVLGAGFKEADANAGPNLQFFVDLTLDNGNTFETTSAGTQPLGNQF